MNKVFMIGNLTRDPEMSSTPNGVPICKFAIAVNRRFSSNNDGSEPTADFFNVTAWRGLAENCGKYLAKGRKVAVVGSIQTRVFEDQSGVKKYFTDISADDVEFLTPKNEAGDAPVRSGGAPVAELKPVESDDLPF